MIVFGSTHGSFAGAVLLPAINCLGCSARSSHLPRLANLQIDLYIVDNPTMCLSGSVLLLLSPLTEALTVVQVLHYLLPSTVSLMQVLYCFLLSAAWGAQNGHLTFPVFQTIREIYASRMVPETVEMGWGMHGASLTGLTIGTLLFGKRLTPVTGNIECLRIFLDWK